MAQVTNTLAAITDIAGPIEVVDHIGSADVNGAASIMVEAGAGTIVIEGSPGQDVNGVDMWIILPLITSVAGVSTPAANIVAGALQYGWSELVGIRKVRARCSVAGAGARVTLTMKAG